MGRLHHVTSNALALLHKVVAYVKRHRGTGADAAKHAAATHCPSSDCPLGAWCRAYHGGQPAQHLKLHVRSAILNKGQEHMRPMGIDYQRFAILQCGARGKGGVGCICVREPVACNTQQ